METACIRLAGVSGTVFSVTTTSSCHLIGARRGRPFPDPLVKVYDIRQLKTLSNIPFSTGPSFLNTIPRRSASTVVITSQEGLVNIVDSFQPDATEVFQVRLLGSGICVLLRVSSKVNASYLNCAAVSPTGTYMAFGDADGTIHMMSSSAPNDEEELQPLNGFEGQRIEWADITFPIPEVDWDAKT
jgi:PAB-dependent poly(A)-specific ribonuclease subunit 2